MTAKVRKNVDCCIVEVDFPAITPDRLDPLIDLLTEMLAEERFQELEPDAEEGKK